MTLFYTVNQPIVFWLFCYLGFVSGSVFFAVFRASQKIGNKKILKENITKKPLKKDLKKEDKKQKKIIIISLKIAKSFIKFFSTIFCILVFFIVIISSYFLNLNLNYGEVSVVNILVYFCAFVLSDLFVKTVANFLYSFYNKRRMRKHNR